MYVACAIITYEPIDISLIKSAKLFRHIGTYKTYIEYQNQPSHLASS